MEKNSFRRNFVARDMHDSFHSKRFDNDRSNRRANDVQNSWKNEEYCWDDNDECDYDFDVENYD